MSMPKTVGVLYGSSTCFTEMAGEAISREIVDQQPNLTTQLHDIADDGLANIKDYDLCILGIPTWDYGELQEDWDAHWDDLVELDLSGKIYAIYGLGDQIGYPTWFQDAVGYLHAVIKHRGGTLLGEWPIASYEFEESKALNDAGTHFVGLALDDETQPEHSPRRIEQWVAQILAEYDKI